MSARLATSSFGVLIILAIGCQKEQAPTSPSLPAVQTMTLSGVVLDTAANPVQNASVEIFSGATAPVSASTDVAGRFSIVFDRVASQALSVRVTKSGFHPVTVNSLPSHFTPRAAAVQQAPDACERHPDEDSDDADVPKSAER